MQSEDMSREVLIQNKLNASVIDTILNVKRVFVLGLYPVLVIAKGFVVGTVLTVIASYLVFRFWSVSIRDKESRVDLIAIHYADQYLNKWIRKLIDKIERFLLW